MKLATRLTAVLASAGLLFGGTTAVESGADLTVNSPERVVVNQAYEWVPWRIGGHWAHAIEDATVHLERAPSRSVVDLDWTTHRGDRAGRFQVDDFMVRPGRHKVWVDAVDRDYIPMSAKPDFITIKFGSRASLVPKRAGKRVTLRSRAMRWNSTWSEWTPFRATVVTFQRKTPRGWKFVGRDKPNRRGVAQISVRRKAPARYRAVVRGTAGVWKSTSAVKRR